MYAQFFGLAQEPFSIAPDPRYLFMSERHREALAHLLYGLGGGGGFVLLTGEIGAGKTTVCRCFLEQVPRRCNVAYIFNPKLTATELLRTVCDEYRIPYRHHSAGVETVKDYIDPLNEFLLRTHSVGQNNVLIIDEAQNLSAKVLEQLRLLTNLETSERKLLQIILIGQPELRTMLERPEMEQVAQRVVARFHLPALSQEETAAYIRHRLAVGGMNGAVPFDAKAMRRIHQLTRGVPRRINLLCDRSLLGAYAEGEPRVTAKIVDKAAGEVFGHGAEAAVRRLPAGAPWLGAGALAGAALAGVIGWAWASRGESLRPVALAQAKPAAQAAASSAASAPGAATAASGANGATAASAAKLAATASTAKLATAAPTAKTASAAPAPAAASALVVAASGAAPAAARASTAAASAPAGNLDALLPSEADALRTLAGAWHVDVPAGADPCRSAQRQQVACFRSNGGLALIRQLDRPGILSLRGEQNRLGYALLTGLDGERAQLQTSAGPQSVPIGALATRWTGDFATLWRAPSGYAGTLGEGSSGPAVDGLVAQFAKLDGATAPNGPQNYGSALKSRVIAFQLAHGLKADGQAGATTFMQLNRATGIDEPRLRAEN